MDETRYPNKAKLSSRNIELLKLFGQPHIDSFNYFTGVGLQRAIRDLHPVEFLTSDKTKIKLQITKAKISAPRIPENCFGTKTQEIYPLECRHRKISYSGPLSVSLTVSINDGQPTSTNVNVAKVPIMLQSNICNLSKLSQKELVKVGEHENEWGGYFVVKGQHRLIRMLLNCRRNYPLAMKRSTWKSRDNNFSDLGVYIRCVASDETAVNNVLHFLTDGSMKLMIAYRKSLFFVPVFLILRCFVDYTDALIYNYVIKGFENDGYKKNCVIEMMRAVRDNKLDTQLDALCYIGKLFRARVRELPEWVSDDKIGLFILKQTVLIHLKDNKDKFRLLVMMIQKLFQAAKGHCLLESPDTVMFQEVLLGGHTCLKLMKEKLQNWLHTVKSYILKQDKGDTPFTDTILISCIRQSDFLTASLENFFSTGNVVSQSGLGLPQDRGLTIIAENISIMRYMSHFRAVHRGSAFEQMRTTEPRQLLSDAWGFICPVHTPDGTPCGLLNHLTRTCQLSVVPNKVELQKIPSILVTLGMIPLTESSLKAEHSRNCKTATFKSYYIVMLDGRIIGHVPTVMARKLTDSLRYYKVIGEVPKTLEIALLEHKDDENIVQFPGLFLYSGPARMMRPVQNILLNQIELIGSFEQVYLNIALQSDPIIPEVYTHQELNDANFLSLAASLIPLPDFNQSPRNMYQCQMGKQTMGTACHNWSLRADTKLYRLQNPTSPLFRPVHHDLLGIDDFPMGTNAVVAVVSYTGFDMEDAMIINQSSLDRGFAHGSIYKCELVELDANMYFERDCTKIELQQTLDVDGLPFVGVRIKPNDVYYCYFDVSMQHYSYVKYKGKEDVFVEAVRACGDFASVTKPLAKVSILFRLTRNPSVGDKFASRAGQKGIFSLAYRCEDLPFTEDGIVPDIIFNPHGFPSRMTIVSRTASSDLSLAIRLQPTQAVGGKIYEEANCQRQSGHGAMMIEFMAGKSAAMHGLIHDASPFKFGDDESAINYFGELLAKVGYNFRGNERMYSGTTGTEMEADIFCGIIHYQRLRHMVSDKWQVRSTGAVDIITRQPVKGLKRGGGGRIGEMERDALIAHGATTILLDRLVHCSDKAVVLLCTKCNSLIAPTVILESKDEIKLKKKICKTCQTSKSVSEIGIPYGLRYLLAELASINVDIKIILEDNNEENFECDDNIDSVVLV